MTSSKLVLVVEDHAPTREAYAPFLSDCGYRVLVAAHGGQAILHLHRYHPDLVLLDISMPVLDGVETAKSLREYPASMPMRILGVTGCESAVQRKRMHALCDDVLTKPCAPELVAARIHDLLVEAG